MNTAVTTPQSFEERVYQRMRENIGELMTDEEMKKLLSTAMERMFFEKREKPNAYRYDGDDRYFEPPINKLVRDMLEPKMRDALAAYLNERSAEVQKAIDDALAGGFTNALARALNQRMAEPFLQLQNQIYELMSANNLRSGS